MKKARIIGYGGAQYGWKCEDCLIYYDSLLAPYQRVYDKPLPEGPTDQSKDPCSDELLDGVELYLKLSSDPQPHEGPRHKLRS